MEIIGIIAEYNPFHNGHLYHINQIKKMYPDSTIVLVLSTSFSQRGIPSIINKWDKTNIALNNNIDLVIELPYIFSTQSSDIFAKEAIKILKELKVDKLIFGSESNDIEKLTLLASTQLNNKEYNSLVKKYLAEGINYPTAMNKALIKITGIAIKESNDLLGLSYIKEIIRQKANIEYISIKRTNNYLDTCLNNEISSATAIREAIKNKIEIKKYIPLDSYDSIKKQSIFMDNYFDLLKYKIISTNDLKIYLDVDEGIENRIKKNIDKVYNYEQLLSIVKSKRYTYNKLNRMFCHILCGYTKELNNKFKTSTYIRVLGLNDKGKNHLNKIKKDTSVPIITKFIKNNDILNFELKVTKIYVSPLDINYQKEYIEKEYKNSIIIK